MSETIPALGQEVDRSNINLVPTPHSLEELWGYFHQKEAINTNYAGYADLAATIVDSIEMVERSAHTSEELDLQLPIMPGRSDALWISEQTPESRELVELLFAVYKLEPIADETTENQPYGRVLWKSMEPNSNINIVVHHWRGHKGDAMRLIAVAGTPSDIEDARQAKPVYSPETTRAIAASRKLGSLSRRRIHEARDAELDYFEFIQALPETEHESPADRLAA